MIMKEKLHNLSVTGGGGLQVPPSPQPDVRGGGGADTRHQGGRARPGGHRQTPRSLREANAEAPKVQTRVRVL